MSDFDLDAILQEAFRKCDRLGHSLNEEQKWIVTEVIRGGILPKYNPLAQLNDDQRQALLQFIQAEGHNWKISLLNDWVQNRDSGPVQFVRDAYGMRWLETITSAHIAEYAGDEEIRLQVGDRIEISNALWEWVPQADQADWFPCVVIDVGDDRATLRFDNGNEFELQGLYDWNRPNWRWT
jgi:hypothetical protein